MQDGAFSGQIVREMRRLFLGWRLVPFEFVLICPIFFQNPVEIICILWYY